MTPRLYVPEAEGRQELPEDNPTARGDRRARVSNEVCVRGRTCSGVGICACDEKPVTVVIVDPYTGKEVGRL